MYLQPSPDGDLACKVFDSSGVTKLVQWFFFGAPNPYVWNQDAIACAELRRRILTILVDFWFGGRVRVADAVGHHWNEVAGAYELRTRFCDGRPPRLLHPLRTSDTHEHLELTDDILPVLQERLVEAGFDGLLWQAGLGNRSR